MSLADKIEQSLKVTKKHKPQRAVKGTLCRSFSLDGNLFIEKFDLVQGTESMQNRNFRAKTTFHRPMRRRSRRTWNRCFCF